MGSVTVKRAPCPSVLSTATRAAVAVHDALRDREAQAGALSDRLGREERVPDAVQVLGRRCPGRRPARPARRDRRPAATVRTSRCPPAGHRLHGVHAQVHHHAAQPALAAPDRRQVGGELHAKPRCAGGASRSDSSASVSRTARLRSTQTGLATYGWPSSSSLSVVSRQRRVSCSSSASTSATSRVLLGGQLDAARPALQALDAGQDRGERVVDLVRDARREQPERGEPLVVRELRLELGALGDVAPHLDDERDLAVRRRAPDSASPPSAAAGPMASGITCSARRGSRLAAISHTMHAVAGRCALSRQWPARGHGPASQRLAGEPERLDEAPVASPRCGRAGPPPRPRRSSRRAGRGRAGPEQVGGQGLQDWQFRRTGVGLGGYSGSWFLPCRQ